MRQHLLLFLTILFCTHSAAQTCESPIDLGTQGYWQTCFDAPLSVSDPWQPDCPNYYDGGGYWIRFEIPELPDGEAFTIQLFSDIAYSNIGDSIVWCHALIADACEGNVLWNTNACGLDADGFEGSFPGTDWFVDIYQPSGEYWLQIPLGISGSSEELLQGCMTIYAGSFSQLSLHFSVERPKKIMTSSGVYIIIDGNYFDITGRPIDRSSIQIFNQ